MCRLSGRHGTYSIAARTGVNTGLGLLVPPVSGSDNSCGSLGQVLQIEKRHWSHGVAGSYLAFQRSREARHFEVVSVGRHTFISAKCCVHDTLTPPRTARTTLDRGKHV